MKECENKVKKFLDEETFQSNHEQQIARYGFRHGWWESLEWIKDEIESYYWSYDTDTDVDNEVSSAMRELLVDICSELETDQYK